MAIEKNQPAKKIPLRTVDTRDFPGEDALTNAVIEEIKIAGACIIRNLIPQRTIDKVVKDLEPHLNRKAGHYTIRPGSTTIFGLAAKSETFALDIVGNPLWQRVNHHFLTQNRGTFWLGSQQITNWSQPYLSGCGTFYVHPGGDPQDLHRDDFVYSHRNGEAKEYVVGRDMMINMLVACTESVKANGATRLIPGSHLWDYSVPCSEDDVVWADLQPGDALMILGSVFHAGSRNTTDRVRHVLSTTAVRGEFRGEENGYLTYSKEQILRLPVHLQKFFGYTFFPPSLNYVDFKDFLHRIDPDPPAKEFAHWIGQLTGVEESD